MQESTAIHSKPNLNLQIIRTKSLTIQTPITRTGSIFADKTSKIKPLAVVRTKIAYVPYDCVVTFRYMGEEVLLSNCVSGGQQFNHRITEVENFRLAGREL